MKKRTRSILEELNNLGTTRDTEFLIESKGQNLIESAINLLGLIRKQYTESEALEIERRFLNAIRSGDGKKFTRGIKKVQENRKKAASTPEN
jgi:hypothetical protein